MRNPSARSASPRAAGYARVARRFLSLGCLVVGLVAVGCVARRSGDPAAYLSAAERLVVTPGHRQPISVWVDSLGNWERLSTREGIAALLDRCAEVGIDVVVLETKSVLGYVLHESDVAPRLREWNGRALPEGHDPLRIALEEARRRGLRVFAGVNVFAGGLREHPDRAEGGVGTVFDTPEGRSWRSEAFVVPDAAPPSDPVVYVSPAHPEVIRHQLAVVEEIARRYPVDGICLARVRFSGLEADVSPWARRSFEAWLGRTVARWPEDVVFDASGVRAAGPLPELWLQWRAETLRDFVLQVRGVVRHARPGCLLADYTGAWYPESYREGGNWASPRYDASRDFDWASPRHRDAAYAHLLDVLYSGWYFPFLREAEALAAGVEPWASLEGAARTTRRVVGDTCPVHAALYLPVFEGDRTRARAAVRAAYDLSSGLLLHDAGHLDEFEWWEDIRTVFPERRSPPPAP